MLILTLPLVLPVTVGLGYHPVWTGIYLTILMEIAMLTPPIGLNVFVLERATGGAVEPHLRRDLAVRRRRPGAGRADDPVPGLALWLPGLGLRPAGHPPSGPGPPATSQSRTRAAVALSGRCLDHTTWTALPVSSTASPASEQQAALHHPVGQGASSPARMPCPSSTAWITST